MPITHRRRDSTVELIRVVLAVWTHPLAVAVPVYNFLCCWAVGIGDKWRHNDVIAEKSYQYRSKFT